jgi:hypothetical protein
LSRRVEQGFRDPKTARDNEARDLPAAKLDTSFLLAGCGQTFKVIDLGVSKNLDALAREVLEKSREGQPGPVDGRFADLAGVPNRGPDKFHLEHLGVAGIELANFDRRCLRMFQEPRARAIRLN